MRAVYWSEYIPCMTRHHSISARTRRELAMSEAARRGLPGAAASDAPLRLRRGEDEGEEAGYVYGATRTHGEDALRRRTRDMVNG